jgi:flavin reductase (DIM6/NTAB) family NADH-FMN oxidoreductase RutF
MAENGAEAGFDDRAYRRALGGFGTGVALVAAEDGEGLVHGLIINSLTSVSLHPPIILWCLVDTCQAFSVFTDCPAFSINILGHDDQALAHQFSRRGDRIIPPDQLVRMETGAPVLAAAVASLDCRVRKHERVGDHEVIYGDVAAYRAAREGDALGYFRGRYVKLSLEE